MLQSPSYQGHGNNAAHGFGAGPAPGTQQAPFNTASSTHLAYTASAAAPQLVQNSLHGAPNGFAPPPPQQSPHALHQEQHQPDHTRQYPMAAPLLPHTPTNQQASNAMPSPKSPQSPKSQNREQQRIELLFAINVQLLQEVNRLQTEGQGGAISPQQVMQLRNEGKPDKMASDEYIQCLRRVQANLSYLMPKAQTDPASQAKQQPGPAHMTPPPHMTQLQPQYDQLRELFPGWQGMDHRMSGPGSSASPRPSGSGPSNGMTASAASAQA